MRRLMLSILTILVLAVTQVPPAMAGTDAPMVTPAHPAATKTSHTKPARGMFAPQKSGLVSSGGGGVCHIYCSNGTTWVWWEPDLDSCCQHCAFDCGDTCVATDNVYTETCDLF